MVTMHIKVKHCTRADKKPPSPSIKGSGGSAMMWGCSSAAGPRRRKKGYKEKVKSTNAAK